MKKLYLIQIFPEKYFFKVALKGSRLSLLDNVTIIIIIYFYDYFSFSADASPEKIKSLIASELYALKKFYKEKLINPKVSPIKTIYTNK